MSKASGLKVEYIKPREDIDEASDHKRLVKFISLFAQVGFKELYLNPDTNIKFDYSK